MKFIKNVASGINYLSTQAPLYTRKVQRKDGVFEENLEKVLKFNEILIKVINVIQQLLTLFQTQFKIEKIVKQFK